MESKVLGPSLIAGKVWFDADTYEVVRLTFVFVGQYTWVSPNGSSAEDSADARRGNIWAQRIAKLEADLEYALYDRVYWMPYRQLLQVTVEIPWFLNVKVPIRFMTTFGEYDVNRSVLPKFAVALDSTLEQTDLGEHWRRRRSGLRCPEVATLPSFPHLLFRMPPQVSTFSRMSHKPFIIDEYVRWSDVDQAGIIFYGAYVRFFEIAETELFRAAGVPHGEVFDRFDMWLPRVHLECDFMFPARLDDRLRVAAYITRFGNSSIQLNFDVLHLKSGKLAAAGHEVLVVTDRTDMKSRPVPDELRECLEAFSTSEAEARSHLFESVRTEV